MNPSVATCGVKLIGGFGLPSSPLPVCMGQSNHQIIAERKREQYSRVLQRSPASTTCTQIGDRLLGHAGTHLRFGL